MIWERNRETIAKGIEKRTEEFEAIESKIGGRRYRTRSATEQKAEKIRVKTSEGLFDVEVAELKRKRGENNA